VFWRWELPSYVVETELELMFLGGRNSRISHAIRRVGKISSSFILAAILGDPCNPKSGLPRCGVR
jgi:hypothetical protein